MSIQSFTKRAVTKTSPKCMINGGEVWPMNPQQEISTFGTTAWRRATTAAMSPDYRQTRKLLSQTSLTRCDQATLVLGFTQCVSFLVFCTAKNHQSDLLREKQKVNTFVRKVCLFKKVDHRQQASTTAAAPSVRLSYTTSNI